ncbi:unnamed protein product [Bursaphelenchus xylophilus]|uniref:(pine wood nematode) hypothetical protein n=1 Tax=Bursaphelenchus xylophilus TaxID=6326 RepID=A0A1I7S1Y4_BURXY|nr:unnamed protein product [Bursaphelenchus xylophilus]CAG9090109.1 unnamed protein product [Bursaphelenchus xylophilus]
MGINVGLKQDEARQWAEHIQLLKNTTDSMHEICAARRNVLGCQEALMYLTNAVRDFEALISTIKVEAEWENLENRPQALAWEVKGVPNRKSKDVKTNGNGEDVNGNPASKYPPLYSKNNKENEALKYNGGRISQPKSAMDIPQTKSSMAKIAYSRQLLWQQHKKLLTEKLTVKRRKQKDIILRRKSMPVLGNATNMQNMESNLESIHEEDRNTSDSCSLKTQVGYYSKSEPQGILDLNNDDEWKALTEEEESLAHEEASLQKEIEDEESASIDEQIHENIILDFSDLERSQGSRWKAVVDRWDINNEPEVKNQEVKFPQPGDTARLHQRLLSPVRKKKYDVDVILERQQKAEEMRAHLRERKAERLRELHFRVEEINRKRMELIEKKRIHLQKKMEKAAENRQKNIDLVVKQAKDVDQRVLEVNFINSLEAENAKYGLQMKELNREYRVQSLMDGKRNAEKAAKNELQGVEPEKKPKEKSKAEKKMNRKNKLLQPFPEEQKRPCSSAFTFGAKEDDIPSDKISGTKWRCECGKGLVMSTSLDILAHFMSTDHCRARNLDPFDFDYNILQNEVEQCIFECNIEDEPASNSTSDVSQVLEKLMSTSKPLESVKASNSKLISQFQEISAGILSEMENISSLDNEINEWKRAFRKRKEAEKNKLAPELKSALSATLGKISALNSGRLMKIDKIICKLANLLTALYYTEQQKLEFICTADVIHVLQILSNNLPEPTLWLLNFLDSFWGVLLKNMKKDFGLFERIQLFNELAVKCNISAVICKCFNDPREEVEINGVKVIPVKLAARFFQFLLQCNQNPQANMANVMNGLISSTYEQVVHLNDKGISEIPDPLKQGLLMVVDFWNTFWSKNLLETQIHHELTANPKAAIKMAFIFRTLLWNLPSGQEISTPALRAIGFGLAALTSLQPHFRVFCLLGWEKSVAKELAHLYSKIFQPPELRYSILVSLLLVTHHNPKALRLIRNDVDVSWFTAFLKRLIKKPLLDGVENLRFLAPEQLEPMLTFFSG